MLHVVIYRTVCFRSEKCQQTDLTNHQNQALMRYRRLSWGRWSTPFFALVTFPSQSSTRVQNYGSNSIRVIPTSNQALHRLSRQTGRYPPPLQGCTAGRDHLYMDLQTAAPLSLERPAHLFHKQQRLDLGSKGTRFYKASFMSDAY